MKKICLITTTICFGSLLANSPASAADLSVKAPAYKTPVAGSVYNWTGIYIGINGGDAWGRESWLDNSTRAASISHSPSDGVFGAHLGFRYQINQFVLGVEGTWDWAGLSDTVSTPGIFTEEFKVKSLYTVTGQVGFAWDRWLPYVKGGWAGATTSLDLVSKPPVTPPVTAFNSQTNSGWTVGAGVDYAVWQNLILGVEYDHFDLNYATFTAPVSNGAVPLRVTDTSRLRIDQVVARLSYKFWTP